MNKLEHAKAQVSEVTDIMRQNVARVMERDTHLDELDSKAGELVMGASQFQAQSTHLKRKMWWKNMKFMMSIGGGLLLLILFYWVSHSSGSKLPADVDSPGMRIVDNQENKIADGYYDIDDDEDNETIFEDDDDYDEDDDEYDDEEDDYDDNDEEDFDDDEDDFDDDDDDDEDYDDEDDDEYDDDDDEYELDDDEFEDDYEDDDYEDEDDDDEDYSEIDERNK